MQGQKNLSFNYLKGLNVNAMPQKEAPYNGHIILIYFKGNHFQWTVYKIITF